jgi:hypothetical protein
MVDQLTAPGGFLGGFMLAGIMLPIALSFVVDGAVLYFRGRGPMRLLLTAAVTLAIMGLYSVAWQNAIDTGQAAQLSGMIGLILWFSIPAALIGLGVRMIALIVNPTSKAIDKAAAEKRAERHEARVAARHHGMATHA